MAKETCNWKLEAPQGDLPLPRSNHTAVDIGENQMLVFGGLFSSNQRFNDTYILKIGKSNSFFISGVKSTPQNSIPGQIFNVTAIREPKEYSR
jgi:hypothetical protein